MVKRLPATRETRVRFLGREDPLEKEMAIHSSTLVWKIPWMEEPDRLQSMGSQRVGHDWATSLSSLSEELKNEYAEANNKIIEIKNSLEWINSRISEAEEQISELEDKMVDIAAEKQNKVKRMKRTEDSLKNLYNHIKCTNIWIIMVPEEEEKKMRYEKIFEEIIVENSPQHGKGNSQSSPRGTKSPIQAIPKEKQTKTHTNQTNKD